MAKQKAKTADETVQESRAKRKSDYESNVQEFRTQLKTFIVERVTIRGDQQCLLVTCPQTNPPCDGWFIVPLRWAKKKNPLYKLHTRSCPWCYRTSQVPKLPKRKT